MLHHDCVPYHTAISVNKVLTKKGFPVVPKPQYSPDLTPCDFLLFPKLKFHLKFHHFGTVDNILEVVTDRLMAFPHEDFQHCYRDWKQLLRRYVASQGSYFEGTMLVFSSVVNKKCYSASRISFSTHLVLVHYKPKKRCKALLRFRNMRFRGLLSCTVTLVI
jgi:hypothetical protein